MSVKFGVQLYTLRSKIQNYADTEETFKFLNSIGCNIVQISGIGPLSAQEKAELVKRYSMDVCVTHTDFERMKSDIDTVIDEHKMINCDCLGIGGMPSYARGDLESLKAFIADCTAVGARMKERGCRFAYHNHAFEYDKIDGNRTIMDILIEDTDPDLFWFIPDVAWMHIAGVDPVTEFARMKGRVKVAHFKDYKMDANERVFTEIGNGIMDFTQIYNAACEFGIPYIVYEQDSGFEDPIESTRISFKNLKKLACKD